MAFPAAAVVPGWSWATSMLTLAFMALLGVSGIASNDISAEEQTDVGMIGHPNTAETASAVPTVPMEEQLRHQTGDSAFETKSVFSKRLMVAITLLVFTLVMMAYVNKSKQLKIEKKDDEEEKEEEEKKKMIQKLEELERVKKESEKTEELLANALDSFMDKLYTGEQRVKAKIEAAIRKEFDGLRNLIGTFMAKAKKEDLEKPLKEETDDETDEEPDESDESDEETDETDETDEETLSEEPDDEALGEEPKYERLRKEYKTLTKDLKTQLSIIGSPEGLEQSLRQSPAESEDES